MSFIFKYNFTKSVDAGGKIVTLRAFYFDDIVKNVAGSTEMLINFPNFFFILSLLTSYVKRKLAKLKVSKLELH